MSKAVWPSILANSDHCNSKSSSIALTASLRRGAAKKSRFRRLYRRVVTSGADKFEDRAAALWGREIASALCKLGGLQLGRSQRDGDALSLRHWNSQNSHGVEMRGRGRIDLPDLIQAGDSCQKYPLVKETFF